MRKRLCALVLSFAGLPLHAQDVPVAAPEGGAEFHAEVAALYDFLPADLSRAQMEAKSGQLDAFWVRVKADPASFGPALRRELARDDAPKFFLYDGSMLLLDLGRKSDEGQPATAATEAPVNKDDAQLVIASMARCTLEGIQDTDYLRKVHWLASQGNDTTAAALHALDDPKFSAFIAQHTLTLGQDYSVICMLMPIDEASYLQPALDRLKSEADEKACRTLLKLLWYTATEAGDLVIEAIAQDKARSMALRQAAGQLALQSKAITMKIQGEERARVAKAVDIDPGATVAELKAERRKRMAAGISDEALADLDQLTLLIRSSVP